MVTTCFAWWLELCSCIEDKGIAHENLKTYAYDATADMEIGIFIPYI
jgi:hypothetical protein